MKQFNLFQQRQDAEYPAQFPYVVEETSFLDSFDAAADLVVCPYCYGTTYHVHGETSQCSHCRSEIIDT